MLCAVGDLVEDVVAHVDGPLRPGADAPARVSRHRGGSAANAAAAAARLTGRSRLVASVGDDDTGHRLVADLEALGVDVVGERKGRTGTIVVLVTAGGERTFVTDRGAAPELSAAPAGVLDDVDVLHLAGYGLVDAGLGGVIRALAAAAHRADLIVAVDPSSTSIAEDVGVEAYRDAIGAVDPTVLLPNSAEAAQLDLLGRPMAPLTVVTDGAGPTTVLDAGERDRIAVAPAGGSAVDTTGAGDAFSAGFLTARAAGRSVSDSVDHGHAAAAHVVSGAGADWWQRPEDAR